MCGILAMIGKKNPETVKKYSKRMSHRGPDESGFLVCDNKSILTHERLSIIDLTTGRQPIQGKETAYVVHNGEIYNHMELRKGILSKYKFRSTCDSEVIVHLYEEFGYDFCNKLDGVFAFAVLDGDKYIVGRDPIGVKPLYYGKDKQGNMFFASEMKALSNNCSEFHPFPPGHYYTPETGFVKFFMPDWEDHKMATRKVDLTALRKSLTEATRKRLMSDVPLGVLLSGGLDSGLISSITKRLLRDTGQELHSFSIGLDPEAPDLVAARKVADFIGTTHHEIYFTVKQGIEALEKIIWHLETYDVTTVRAATPMYFLAQKITEMGIKVVLSGEGADEIFGGYLYFHNAPSPNEYQKELINRVLRLSTADCLRADKSTMAHGLEARVPFLDKHFLDLVMKFRPEDKQPNRSIKKPEKYILRAAFDDKKDPYLPKEILWRQKEQFGDGVGYNWIDGVIDYCNRMVSDQEFAKAKELFPFNTPDTKEAFYFRKIYAKHFPEEDAARTVKKWIPKWQKNTDPSGRVCDEHLKKVEDIQKIKLKAAI